MQYFRKKKWFQWKATANSYFLNKSKVFFLVAKQKHKEAINIRFTNNYTKWKQMTCFQCQITWLWFLFISFSTMREREREIFYKKTCCSFSKKSVLVSTVQILKVIVNFNPFEQDKTGHRIQTNSLKHMKYMNLLTV